MLNKLTRWMQRSEEDSLPGEWNLNPHNIPKHVAIIMDGNGRWAKQRALPRVAGHRAGMKTVKEITKAADEIGIEVLTLYAFSTENWKRPADEVEYLMRLPQEYLATELKELIERNVQVRMVGYEESLPEYTLKAVREAREKTRHNTGLILNFALNYGSRAEMVTAVKQIVQEVQEGKLDIEQINEEMFGSYLTTRGLPDPDLLIRTSGELRLSNFMLWQLAYSEFWFSDVYWPDFSRNHFFEAIKAYQQRNRRYGALT
ncbi:isoprenyl transferase [Aneurinibacillus thermoaerophilus]|uniref:Isoprenyl transferase n=1 Tax=Aneurinibacillus thermoaerophilus TaxID=143495 RepID=A0A1G7WG08_ANETH|nr:UDP pyrophosphate synthase [Aneurinibacillus sp. XH2]QYY41549.1 isoprenyl transferase [Aneurinibacillus thermoaerophilus]SDG70871.1 undecaprenyl diphosphate synthase [Aneurinibacillus thermoaerophilus]